ncbi:hypothetical protein HZI73_02590 [Vallitalea pronyensis]|uniref:Uncharacterized protein n=1 Tax=Vallitalea pronyensis TaxID=1348613 RepID=A0A8J8SF48_9FIRM|nr:hypothetical protein [Vallitalea pronyensis]QUI21236.1 hypothetical protein HZI73_02590 [Vallitalea pronyensis]
MNSVNGVAGYQTSNQAYSTKTKSKGKTDQTKEKEAVIYEKGKKNQTSVSNYSELKPKKYTVDKKEIEAMKNALDERLRDSFYQMVKDMVGKQNTTYSLAIETILTEKQDAIKPEMIEQAKIDIAEGGYWSPKNTADRILQFAKAISGGDPEKADMLKASFLRGFEEAEKAWGGALPEICQKTKEAVLEGFNAWKYESDNETVGQE